MPHQTILQAPPVISRLETYLKVRRQTENLCRGLQPEDFVLQPMVDVSPARWHLAHTTWYFETFLLKPFLNGYTEFHPRYNYLFNSYYDSVGDRWQRDRRGSLSRPTVGEVMEYRRYVDEHMQRLLENRQETTDSEFEAFFTIGLNHEQQHQELLVTDTKYSLGLNPLFPSFLGSDIAPPYTQEASAHAFLAVDEGTYSIGATGKESFTWDNEKPAHRVFLEPFEIGSRLVTNEEYMEFMGDGGYGDYRHWLMEGWALVKAEQWQAPLHWHRFDGEWFQYTTNGLMQVNPDAPVTHISFYEAEAYAEWKGCRLPTEQEWEAAAKTYAADMAEGNYADNGHFQPLPASGSGPLLQMGGDCWEWTYSGYFPYPSYRRAEGALGEYNGKFMINQMVLRGGSCATPKDHIRTTYRNFFHPDKRWQFSGIRLAKSI